MNMLFVHAVQEIWIRDGNILLYCENGRSRSPAFLAAYLIAAFGYNVKDALKTLQVLAKQNRGIRFIIDRDSRFLTSLFFIEKLV